MKIHLAHHVRLLAGLSAAVGLCLVLQGCVVANAVIAYESAVGVQRHAAYTDYLFAMQAKNEALHQTGQPPEVIWSKDAWVKMVHNPRQAYADYYLLQIKDSTKAEPVMSYDTWLATEWRKKLDEDERERQNRNQMRRF